MLGVWLALALAAQVSPEGPSVRYSNSFSERYWQVTGCDDVLSEALPVEPPRSFKSRSGLRTAVLVRTNGGKIPYDRAEARLTIDGPNMDSICLKTAQFRNLSVHWNGDGVVFLFQGLGHIVGTEELFDVENKTWLLQRTASYVKGRASSSTEAESGT
ncbi:MAG: hypothetical protein AAF545_06150 [Pseudomonadota bacterium]